MELGPSSALTQLKSTDLSSHLPLIYQMSQTHLAKHNGGIVCEVTIHSGETTMVFSQLKHNHPEWPMTQICVGTEADIPTTNNLFYMIGEDHQTMCQRYGVKPVIDVLMIDHSHYYDVTLERLKQYVPLMADDGLMFIHDTYMAPINDPINGRGWQLNDGTIMFGGWDNCRGVTRAIETYFQLNIDETQPCQMIFINGPNTWLLHHYPLSNGLTVLQRWTAPPSIRSLSPIDQVAVLVLHCGQHSRWVDKCLKSIDHQSWKSYEILELYYGANQRVNGHVPLDGHVPSDQLVPNSIYWSKTMNTRAQAIDFLLAQCVQRKYQIVVLTCVNDYYHPFRFERQIKCLQDGHMICSTWSYLIKEHIGQDHIIQMIKSNNDSGLCLRHEAISKTDEKSLYTYNPSQLITLIDQPLVYCRQITYRVGIILIDPDETNLIDELMSAGVNEIKHILLKADMPPHYFILRDLTRSHITDSMSQLHVINYDATKHVCHSILLCKQQISNLCDLVYYVTYGNRQKFNLKDILTDLSEDLNRADANVYGGLTSLFFNAIQQAYDQYTSDRLYKIIDIAPINLPIDFNKSSDFELTDSDVLIETNQPLGQKLCLIASALIKQQQPVLVFDDRHTQISPTCLGEPRFPHSPLLYNEKGVGNPGSQHFETCYQVNRQLITLSHQVVTYDPQQHQHFDHRSIQLPVKEMTPTYEAITQLFDGETVAIYVSSDNPVMLNYYAKAMSYFGSSMFYLIFSDKHIAWCQRQELFYSLNKHYYVDQLSECQQLTLMTLCQHHITDQSLLGLWGSFMSGGTSPIAPSTGGAPKHPPSTGVNIFLTGTNVIEFMPAKARCLCFDDSDVLDSGFFNHCLVEHPINHDIYQLNQMYRLTKIKHTKFSPVYRLTHEQINRLTIDLDKSNIIVNKTTSLRINRLEGNHTDHLYLIGFAEHTQTYWLINQITKRKYPVDIDQLKLDLTDVVDHINYYVMDPTQLDHYQQVDTLTEIEVHMTIVITSYNNQLWTPRCLVSCINQSYSNYQIVFINTGSTDQTLHIARSYQKTCDKLTIINDPNRKYQTHNCLIGTSHAKCHSIIVSVDGDDQLFDSKVLTILNQIYYATNCLVTHGSYVEDPLKQYASYHPIWSNLVEQNKQAKHNKKARHNKVSLSHLKTWYRELFLAIPHDQLLYDGQYPQMAGDLCFMYPLSELCNNRITFVNRTMYIYNRLNPFNDDRVNQALQMQTSVYFLAKSPLKPIQSLQEMQIRYLKNLYVNDPNELLNRYISIFLKQGNLRNQLLACQPGRSIDLTVKKQLNVTIEKMIDENQDQGQQIWLPIEWLQANFNSTDEFTRIMKSPHPKECHNLAYHCLCDLTRWNRIDYMRLIQKTHSVFVQSTKIHYDIHLIICVKERKDNLRCLLKQLWIIRQNHPTQIIVTIVEIDHWETRQHQTLCHKYQCNYVLIDLDGCDCQFNYALGNNLAHKISLLQGYQADWICSHNVDCLMPLDFFETALSYCHFFPHSKIQNSILCLQPYTQKRVLMTEEWLATQIRDNTHTFDLKSLNSTSKGIILPGQGSTGGSVLIKTSLFEQIGGYDPELFCDYGYEDLFFWHKIQCVAKSQMAYADNPPIELIHLWHPSARDDPLNQNPRIRCMEYLYKLFCILPKTLKLQYIKLKQQLLSE